LVEQATENRRVPSSNLGPGIFKGIRLLSFSTQSQGNNQLMNNADSFAMSFDEVWKDSIPKLQNSELNLDQKLNLIFAKIEDHPFLINNPSQARKVAKFRIRLLNLE
tara:strand:- start:81359 stop:81679 length:321 start_codon:yes stop_codon:yes gene_type:complete